MATTRLAEPGTGEAGDLTGDAIIDLKPRCILVVGIAGAIPTGDATLGDAVFGNRVDDFTLQKVLADGTRTFSVKGGQMSKGVTSLLANLQVHLPSIIKLGLDLPKLPTVPFDATIVAREEIAKKIRENLHARYDNPPSEPVFHDGPIASSDTLVKYAELAQQWATEHQHLLAVEMETAGVYRAARVRQGPDYPVVPIRAVSDVIGLPRDDKWSEYAAEVAAAFALAFVRSWVAPPT